MKTRRVHRLGRKFIRCEALEDRSLLAAHIVGDSTVYPTIQSAVNAAVPGAIINVDAGVYSELVTVHTSVTINGAQKGVDARSNGRVNVAAESVVNGAVTSSGARTSGFYITANNVTIDGFTITGNSTRTYYGAGLVMAPNINGTDVLNNIIEKNFTGLFLSNNSPTNPCVIQHNLFRDNYNPADTTGYWNSGNDNRAIYTDGGISGGFLTNVTIDANEFIYTFSPPDNVEGAIGLESYTPGSQTNIRITNNSMDGVGKCVLFYNVTDITITGNVCTRVGDVWSGVFRDEGNVQGAVIKYNSVYDAYGPALFINQRAAPGESSGFVVQYNNFYNNAVSVNGSYSFQKANGYKATVLIGNGCYNGVIDLRNNYWGAASGPSGIGTGTGTGDAIVINNNDAVYKPFATTPVVPQLQPYFGLPFSEAGVIEAENYDHGGEAIAYHDATLANDGGKFRFGESVDLESTTDTGGGFNVRSAVAGEWLNYTVNLLTGGNYSVAFRLASAQTTGGTFQLDLDGKNLTGSVTAPNTGGAQKWSTVTIKNLLISAGQHVLKLRMNTNGSGGSVASFNWFQLIPVSTSTPPAAPAALVAASVAATSVALNWRASSTNDANSYTVQRSFDGVNFTTLGVTADVNYVDATVTSKTSYVYRVYASNSAGDSGFSNTLAVTTPAVLSAPGQLGAVPLSSTFIKLTWTDTAPTIETGFVVYRSVDGVNFTSIATTTQGATSYTDTTAAVGATYSYRVRTLNGSAQSAESNTATATTFVAAPTSTALSALNWTSATSGWRTVQKNLSVAGNAITIRGKKYTSGLGTHADSTVTYNLAGKYAVFQADLGIDDEVGAATTPSVNFQVWGDGVLLYESGGLGRQSAVVSAAVSVSGVQSLSLVAKTTNGSIDYAHADWAAATLLAAPVAPAAPVNLVATAVSAGAIKLNWTAGDANATGYAIDRSTDGATWNTIASVGATTFNYTDNGLEAGRLYSYRVRATSAAGASAYSGVATATTLPGGVVTALSSLNWTSATTGYGSVQKDETVKELPITLRGQTYTSGIGTHAVSEITYDLAGGYKNFLSDIGVDDEVNGKGVGSVVFQVYGDGKLLFDSGVLTNNSAIVSLNVDVGGVQTLKLVATTAPGGDIDFAHADWAGARLTA